MSDPIIAQKRPAVLELEPGKYFWCQCGSSKNQPFCDGSHKGTEFRPMLFEVTEKQKMALCQCKHTKTAPRCDGTHKTV